MPCPSLELARKNLQEAVPYMWRGWKSIYTMPIVLLICLGCLILLSQVPCMCSDGTSPVMCMCNHGIKPSVSKEPSISALFARAHKASVLNHAYLDGAMRGKPRQAEFRDTQLSHHNYLPYRPPFSHMMENVKMTQAQPVGRRHISMDSGEDSHSVLGVLPDASDTEITDAYMKLLALKRQSRRKWLVEESRPFNSRNLVHLPKPYRRTNEMRMSRLPRSP